ncbi:ABC transporter ATP-binding protein [Mycobacterium malmoense]|uniref:ABC transporter ATP-binding protein n=1 Tax=Mycobacterium malmoense TaxID=1780 RepID=UPI0008F902DF|nr:ABC transporter ATP-binding protein [Mycobacterium malmoense]OIN79255.1 iron ABC transporter ATP-binding protein [Mycobacterium malmoense]
MGVALEVERLSFAYGKGGPRLVEVSLTVPDGRMCCLLGPNGAGKTTLLRCLLGLLTPRSGAVRLAGRPIGQLSRRQLARRIAYVPQSSSTPFPFSTLDIAVTGRTPHLRASASPSAADRRAAAAVLDELGIGALADRPFSVLSSGERRLALIARAMVQDAPVLVLDEPTAALDFGNEARILQLVTGLTRAGRTVLMTTHQPWHALLCDDQAVLMRDGRIVVDGPAPDVVTAQRLSELYGVPVRVLTAVDPSTGRPVYACAPIVGAPTAERAASSTPA